MALPNYILPFKPMPENEAHLEILRTKSREELMATREVLKLADIPHYVTGTKAGFDVLALGATPHAGDLIITVDKVDYERARTVLEESYTGLPLPPGHFLHEAKDEDVMEILAAPNEWSAHDVAHARRLARERNLNTNEINARRAGQVALLSQGKPAPRWVMILGWASAVLGYFSPVVAFVGVGIGYSFSSMKENTPDGKFFTHNAAARKTGVWIFLASLPFFIMWLGLILWFFGRLLSLIR